MLYLIKVNGLKGAHPQPQPASPCYTHGNQSLITLLPPFLDLKPFPRTLENFTGLLVWSKMPYHHHAHLILIPQICFHHH